jgi:hypothetical protein
VMLISADGCQDFNWRKAKRSLNHGACAEVANGRGIVAMRDSKDLNGPVVRYSIAAWRSFVASAKVDVPDVPVAL